MSITDELRDWAKRNQSHGEVFGGLPPKHPFNRFCTVEDLLAIADRIDAEHDVRLREARGEALMVIDTFTETTMAEHGWVRLPMDADGVPIRVGDVLENALNNYAFLPATVVGYHVENGELLPIVENYGEFRVVPSVVRHHNPQTTEDVLRELLDSCENQNDGFRALLIAEYAKRLQLKE